MDDPGFALASARVAVVGLGLMGGSLALALRGHCLDILGVDSDPQTLAYALERSIVDRAADFDSAASAADLLVLATPVRTILSQLERLSRVAGRRSPMVVLDLGSTKGQIVAAMGALPAWADPVGGHPMCGKEASGIANAEPDLYRGRTFALTPMERTSPRAMALAGELVAAVGAAPLVIGAEQHDQLAAMISHLPYAAATALMRAAMSADDDRLWQLAASGFRDTTRLAASDLTVMIDILLTNRAALLDALSRYRAELDALAALVDSADADALRAALEAARVRRGELFPGAPPGGGQE